MTFKTTLAMGLATCLLLPGASTASDTDLPAPQSESWLIGSAGTIALVREYDYPYLVGLQYRAPPLTDWALMPGLGASAGPDGMGYFYADLAHDFALPRQWAVTLSLAAGLFLNGDAIGVNEHLEFQSGLAVSRPFGRGLRVGLAGYHISNGGLAHPNNGTEALVLFVAMALDRSR